MGTKVNDADVSRRDFLRNGAVRAGAGALAGLSIKEVEARGKRQRWDMTADFVTIGAGVAGLAGAVSALDNDASVIMVEENFDIGGHGMVSGGNVHLGGGTSRQKKFGVQDSAEQVFQDWIRYDHRESRYSDRDLVRAFADENAATFEFLIANGVQFTDELTGPGGASTVPRQGTSVQWPIKSEIMSTDPTRRGSGLVRALEKSARAKGAQILLKHRMTSIVRESAASGRVLGITATAEGRTLRIESKKGVLVATGGHTSHVNFRRMFDPRLTEEYQVAGEPYSRQTADGELAAMAIGAVLWATACQTVEAGAWLNKTAHIGCRWGYSSLRWPAHSPIFDRIKASGLTDVNWQNVILVNQGGKRFWNEMASDHDFFNAALGYSGNSAKLNGGGPIWAIFDADAVTRQKWDPKPPNVDPDYFFSADTIAELARKITNPYQARPMPATVLQETVSKYNAYVDAGADAEFKKPTPRYKIQKPPFFAAWSTPILHDSLTGLRTNAEAQVLDMQGQVIPGLYCAGESQGGFAQHGLGRATVFGRIAGRHAARNGGRS
jgi:urocanate reductase